MSNAWIDKHRSSQRRPVEHLSADVTDTGMAFDVSHTSGSVRVEVAGVVSYLASPESGFVTGANWNVDGGYSVV
jgi:NAD(P)-dependent dehydrogenase (short-subunit alcohol dehydrogenase family)